MKSPKVTVLMSVYNGEKYLHEAVDSILNQTFTDFEFLIINDASTDRTSEILQSYRNPRIKVITNEKNIGLTKSLNKGLVIAKGEYIARMDADDMSMPERFEKEIEFLDTHKDYAAVGTYVKVIRVDSGSTDLWERPVTDAQIREHLKMDNCIAHGSAMIRRKCLVEVGFYDESIVRAQDYELWLRLSEKYRLANIPQYLYLRKIHEENIEVKHHDEQKAYVERAKAKSLERRLDRLLSSVGKGDADVKDATIELVTITAENDRRMKFWQFNWVSNLIDILTLGRIKQSDSNKIFIRILFSSYVNRILKDYKKGKISLEETKDRLKTVVVGHKEPVL